MDKTAITNTFTYIKYIYAFNIFISIVRFTERNMKLHEKHVELQKRKEERIK